MLTANHFQGTCKSVLNCNTLIHLLLMNKADKSNKLKPGNDHWLWRSLLALSSGRGRCESLVRAHSHREKRSRKRGHPNSTRPETGFDIGLYMFHLGTLSLANALLNTTLFSAHVDNPLLINSLVERLYSSQSPEFLFTHFFSPHST